MLRLLGIRIFVVHSAPVYGEQFICSTGKTDSYYKKRSLTESGVIIAQPIVLDFNVNKLTRVKMHTKHYVLGDLVFSDKTSLKCNTNHIAVDGIECWQDNRKVYRNKKSNPADLDYRIIRITLPLKETNNAGILNALKKGYAVSVEDGRVELIYSKGIPKADFHTDIYHLLTCE